MSSFRRLLATAGLRRTGTPVSQDGIEAGWLSPWDVGFRDSVLSGWFGHDGALFKGFSITAEDIVLDAGCGDGGYANFCARRGAHVIFADLDPAMVAAAVQRLSGSGARMLAPVVTDCMPLPLADEIATRIIATEMLEHVTDPARVLGELVRVGRHDALYLLSVPDPTAEELQKSLFPERFAAETGHLRIFQHSEFASLITDAGLTIEARHQVGFFWSLWFLLFWNSGVDIAEPRDPTLDNWVQTWEALLDTPGGVRIKGALDNVMPKSQLIIARKP